MAIKVNLNPLGATTGFPYLGRTITYNKIDWAEIYSNLRKSQRIWGMVEKVLGKKGELIKACEMMYKAVFQVVLMYGREIWVVTEAMVTVIEGIHHRIAIRIAGMTVRKSNSREWELASVYADLETTGIWAVREYQSSRQRIFRWCMRSASRQICNCANVHFQGVPGRPGVGGAY